MLKSGTALLTHTATAIAWTCSLVLASAACRISGTVPAREDCARSQGASSPLWAGLSRKDITPPFGFPMGGYSVDGKYARGVWTRLFARAVYLEDSEGRAFVLVSCDLPFIPGGLNDRVAELVRRDSQGRGRHLGREQVVLSATHTHTGPGNFASSPFYNSGASVAPGFDGELFNFLAGRIATAVLEAASHAEPAVVRRSRAWVPNVARNRSLVPFRANYDPPSHLANAEPDPADGAVDGAVARALLDENAELAKAHHVTWEFPPHVPVLPDHFHAADSTLTVLRVESRETGVLLGGAAFFAVHNTVLGNDTEVYASDLFGVAATIAERTLAAESTTSPVIAIFQGAEGDITGNWDLQGRESALRLGGRLAEAILHCVREGGAPSVDGPVGYRSRRFQLDAETRPFVGTAIVGGSEDGRAWLTDGPWREGVVNTGPSRSPPGHEFKQSPFVLFGNCGGLPFLGSAVRWVLGEHLQFVLERAMTPPSEALLGVYRVGSDLAIATLPGEFTTVAGRRIANAVAKELCSLEPALLLGLAHEYVGYFPTWREHALQHYEGSESFYGPAQHRAIRECLTQLARDMSAGPSAPPASEYHYGHDRGSGASFGPRELVDRTITALFKGLPFQRAVISSLANILDDPLDPQGRLADPRFEWEEPFPEWPEDGDSSKQVIPRVAIEVELQGQWKTFFPGKDGEQQGPVLCPGAEDDEGLDLVTVMVPVPFDCRARYLAIWLHPATVDPDQRFRFRVMPVAGNGDPINSAPFTLRKIGDVAWDQGGLVPGAL